jgi:hypothetical protein
LAAKIIFFLRVSDQIIVIGILHEITGKKRYRKFIFKEYVDLIAKGTEL